MSEFVSAIVLDVHLPDLDGFEVCRLLRARRSTAQLPVIHISADGTDEADARAARDCGADALLPVPVDPERLARRLDRLLAERALLDVARGAGDERTTAPGVRSGRGVQSVVDQMTPGEKARP